MILYQCPLWVVCGLTIRAIKRPLFHTNFRHSSEVRITRIKPFSGEKVKLLKFSRGLGLANLIKPDIYEAIQRVQLVRKC